MRQHRHLRLLRAMLSFAPHLLDRGPDAVALLAPAVVPRGVQRRQITAVQRHRLQENRQTSRHPLSPGSPTVLGLEVWVSSCIG